MLTKRKKKIWSFSVIRGNLGPVQLELSKFYSNCDTFYPQTSIYIEGLANPLEGHTVRKDLPDGCTCAYIYRGWGWGYLNEIEHRYLQKKNTFVYTALY